jgi:AraC-like DNA-binding protein
MLRYLNRGERFYGTKDVHSRDHCRNSWEILVVSKGMLRPLILNTPPSEMVSDTLWVLPPESRHCWENPRRQSCYVHVFHFGSVHSMLVNVLPSSRVLSVRLNAADLQAIEEIYNRLEPHYLHPQATSVIAFEIGMLQICEIIIKQDRFSAKMTDFDVNAERVLQAMHWHREHMAEGIKVSDVSRALRVSPSHLRRLFLATRGESPNQAFSTVKIEEACRLMATTTYSMKEVAAICGFGGYSEFYRFFVKQTGESPGAWKRSEFYKRDPAKRQSD